MSNDLDYLERQIERLREENQELRRTVEALDTRIKRLESPSGVPARSLTMKHLASAEQAVAKRTRTVKRGSHSR